MPSRSAPCAWQASSTRISPRRSASSASGRRGAFGPEGCTGIRKRVRSPTAASAAETSMFQSASDISTGTGRPPACVTASRVATKVFAGTITSSPGSIPEAISPRRSASSPLASPIAVDVPTYSANASSNSRTAGPLMNAFESISAEKDSSSSSFRAPCIAPRSRKGTRISTVSAIAISVSRLADELADVDARAAGLERLVHGLDDAHDVEPDLRARARRLARPDCGAEVAELDEERLRGRHVRRDDVAGAGAEPVLAEGLGVRQVDAAVEDAHGLVARVVVDDHLLRADDRRAPELARREPGELDVGDRARGELEVDERDVGHVRDHAAAAERADVPRGLVEPVAQDREVVRAEVPGDTDVALVQAEVHAARRDEVDVAEVAVRDQVADRVDRRAVEEGVAGHQDEVALGCALQEVARLHGRCGERPPG